MGAQDYGCSLGSAAAALKASERIITENTTKLLREQDLNENFDVTQEPEEPHEEPQNQKNPTKNLRKKIRSRGTLTNNLRTRRTP